MRKNNYYLKRKRKLVSRHRRLLEANIGVFKKFYNEPTSRRIIEESLKEYEKLLPQIPYIGGKRNSNTPNLIGAVQLLSVIKILHDMGEKERDIGEIVYLIGENYCYSVNFFLKLIGKRILLSKIRAYKLKISARQKKKYEEDWVFDYIDGRGQDFEFGIDYRECGICKFYEKYGFEKYAHYLCLIDYPMLSVFGISLKRTKTIANGAELCDFRFCGDGKLRQGWPPENLEEFTTLDPKVSREQS